MLCFCQRRQSHVIFPIDHGIFWICAFQIQFEDGDIETAMFAVCLLNMNVQHLIRQRRNDGKSLQLSVNRDDTAFQSQFFEMTKQKADPFFLFLDSEGLLLAVLPALEKSKDIIEIGWRKTMKFVTPFILF